MPNDDIHDLTFTKRGGCCFWVPFLGSDSSSRGPSLFWQRIKPDTPTVAKKEDRWWARGWNKIREWSEIVAGPKWKTLLRRFNKRNTNANNNNNNNNNPQQGGYGKFQYDPLSYSLNFDEGPGQNGHYDDEDVVRRGFSSRYSLPPSAKCSLDFDREGLVIT